MALGLAVLTISDAGSRGEWADVILTTDGTGVTAPYSGCQDAPAVA